MTNPGLIALKQALAHYKGTMTGPEGRAAYETQLAAIPEAAGVEYYGEDVDGVAALWAVPLDAVPGRILLYLHGGGYVMGSARGYRHFAGELGRRARARTLIPGYRLAPEHQFPAAIEDVMTSYRWLLNQGIDARSIIVAGDSSGGGLAAALMVAARDEGLPLPGGAYLLSPWTDLDRTGSSIIGKADADPCLTESALDLMATQYLQGFFGHSPLGSPIHADLKDLPPMLIQVGSDEILLDDSARFAERAQRAGVDVTIEIWPDMFHGWQLFAGMLGEAKEAIEKAGTYMETLFEENEASQRVAAA